MEDAKRSEEPTILIVEDNRDLCHLIQKRLGNLGFRTDCAFTGNDALEKVSRPGNFILLLDYMLPDITALQFIQSLERKQLRIPFIVMTGHGNENAAVDIMKGGARDYIVKDSNIIEMLPHRIKAVVRDLKREKELADAEIALRESEKKYRDLFEMANDAIFVADVETGIIIDANKMAEKMLGMPVERIKGMHQSELHPGKDSERYKKTFQSHIKDGSAISKDIYVVNSDGVHIPVEISANIATVGGREVISGIFRDISERKKTENLLLERVRTAALGDSIGKALSSIESVAMMLSRCSEILVRHLNAAFARIWTLNETDNILELRASAGLYTHIDGAHSRIPVGQYKIGLIAENRRPLLSNSVIGDPRVHDQEWAIREEMVSFAGHPLIAGQRLVGVMAMFSRVPLTDATISALSSIANEIAIGIIRKETETQLAVSLNEKEVLLRELYHRTKNNMQIISSLINLQSLSIYDNNVLHIFRETQNRIRSIALVHEKLYRSHDLSNINLGDYIQDMAGSLLMSYGMSDIVSFSMDAETVYTSIDSAIPCGLIMNEIVTNSLKYAFPDGEKGKISMSLSLNGTTVQLKIRDNGRGFPDGFNFMKTKTLGLKLIRQLTLGQLKGEIKCKSQKGVEYILYFKNEEKKDTDC